MPADPFEHFGEQQWSHEVIEEHREMLVRDALEILAEHPRAEPVGVIMDTESREADEFRRFLEQQVGRPVAGFVGVLPRAMVGVSESRALDFLESYSTGDERQLPVLAFTKNGYRFAAVPLTDPASP